MQYPIIDKLANAYLQHGWTGLDIPQTITYEPIQLGSGTPSPDNIRPILPATTLNIDGVDIPIYGGTLNVTTGELVVDMVEKTGITPTGNGTTSAGIPYIDASYSQNLGFNLPLNTSVICSEYRRIVTTDPGVDGVFKVYSTAFTFYDKRFTNQSSAASLLANVQIVYPLVSPITYQLTTSELENIIGIKDDIAHRLKLPLPYYFPHPVIDALDAAAGGSYTSEQAQILQHYLTPLGIGGI